jgi:cell division protein FtsZ
VQIINRLLEKFPHLANVGVMASNPHTLSASAAESKLLLWEYKGLGSTANIEMARLIVDKSQEDIKSFINSDTVILTAGMGGESSYTLPFVAQIANEMDVRTIGVICTPFSFEGRMRHTRADEGLKLSQASFPILSVISGDEVLKRQAPPKSPVKDMFSILNDLMSKTILFFSDLFQ